MAPTVRQIRQGLADALDRIDGLRAHSTIPGQFSPPAAIVGMPQRRPTETMIRGTDRWNVLIWIVVARQADAQSEKLIEQYLDPASSTSIRQTLVDDNTLGGVVNDVFEESAESTYFVFGSGATEQRFIGLEFDYRVLASGKDT